MSKQDMQIIFLKTYDGESVIDLARDIDEAFDVRYNTIMNDIPVDEHGIQKGSFTVSILWHGEDND